MVIVINNKTQKKFLLSSLLQPTSKDPSLAEEKSTLLLPKDLIQALSAQSLRGPGPVPLSTTLREKRKGWKSHSTSIQIVRFKKKKLHPKEFLALT